MAEPSVATPGSTASGTPGRASAAKDRTCPYCQTQFTSSSLGRHLDLYIKEKNPKPPDGIHDVEQIRRSRGNITRRQARTSSAKREGSTASSAKATPSHDHPSPSISKPFVNGDHGGLVKTTFNAPNWQATGVINGLPPTPRDGRYDIRRDHTRRPPVKIDMMQRRRTNDDRDRGRAAELALKEVLDSIKAAKLQLKPIPAFEFDFFNSTFPTMCLKCLTRPPTITASHIVPSLTSWPITIPGQAQHDQLQRSISIRLKWRMKEMIQKLESDGTNMPDDSINMDEARHQDHLSSAYKSWNALSETQKRDMWQLESLRAYAEEEELHGQTRIQVDRLEQEIEHLRIQVDRLQKSQQPREFLMYSPSQLPISRKEADKVTESKPGDEFDYEKLLEKWKTRVQSSRSTQRSLNDPGLSTPSHHMNGESAFGQRPTNGDRSRRRVSDDDLIDAPGDDDDDLGASERMPVAQMDRGMIDPKLRDDAEDEVMQGIEDGPEGFAGGRLLAGLREYANGDGRGV